MLEKLVRLMAMPHRQSRIIRTQTITPLRQECRAITEVLTGTGISIASIKSIGRTQTWHGQEQRGHGSVPALSLFECVPNVFGS